MYEYQELQTYIPLRSCSALRTICEGLQNLRNDELFDKHIMICFFAVAWIFKLKLNNFNLI